MDNTCEDVDGMPPGHQHSSCSINLDRQIILKQNQQPRKTQPRLKLTNTRAESSAGKEIRMAIQ